MRYIFIIVFMCVCSIRAFGQSDSLILSESKTLDLQFLVIETLMNNPEIRAALYHMDETDASVPQASSLSDPELKFSQMEIPGFNFSEAMYSRWELSQMIRFPTKLRTQGKIAEIRAEHAHHDHLEKVNEVLAKLKTTYFDLWFVQQNIELWRENSRLMWQFIKIANARYGVGETQQQDVLKARVEFAKIQNELLSLRQQEIASKAMLMAILNRTQDDTLGYAVISENLVFTPSLDLLQRRALQTRPMLIHDSLSIVEYSNMLSLAKQEYLPDFTIGIERVTSPLTGFNGWSVSAGITIPFAPWTLAKANSRKEEAEFGMKRAMANYNASRNMIRATVQDLYTRVIAFKDQIEYYQNSMLPATQQSLDASITAYQSGSTGFLMLIDSYRTLVELRKEYFMTRLRFEQAIVELERMVGTQEISSLKEEGELLR